MRRIGGDGGFLACGEHRGAARLTAQRVVVMGTRLVLGFATQLTRQIPLNTKWHVPIYRRSSSDAKLQSIARFAQKLERHAKSGEPYR